MTDVSYCTREQVQSALDQADTIRNNARIDAAIRAGSRDVEGYTHSRFHPATVVRYPDWRRQVQGRVLWLDHIDQEMISVTSFTSDGDELVEGTDFYLDPDGGPPYTSLRLIDLSSAAFSANDRGLVLSGEQGASSSTRAAGSLAGSVASSGSIVVTDSSLVGVGDLLIIGTERMIVVDKRASDTGITLAGAVTDKASARTIAVSDGTGVTAGELIQVGAERMLVESVLGNSLIVKRAENGSVLEAHSSSDPVYAPRTCIVTRGALGSSASSHSSAAAILANDPPALVQEAALAFSLVNLEQGKSAYGRVLGSGDSQREASGRSLQSIVDDLRIAYGRIRAGAA